MNVYDPSTSAPIVGAGEKGGNYILDAGSSASGTLSAPPRPKGEGGRVLLKELASW
jgi:hypothetical protein